MEKQWYLIEIECIKFNPSIDMKIGEKQIIAKVKSQGLAYIVAQSFSEIYKNCNIIIK